MFDTIIRFFIQVRILNSRIWGDGLVKLKFDIIVSDYTQLHLVNYRIWGDFLRIQAGIRQVNSHNLVDFLLKQTNDRLINSCLNAIVYVYRPELAL